MTLGIQEVIEFTPVNVVLIVTMCCLFIGAMMVDCAERDDDDDMDGMA